MVKPRPLTSRSRGRHDTGPWTVWGLTWSSDVVHLPERPPSAAAAARLQTVGRAHTRLLLGVGGLGGPACLLWLEIHACCTCARYTRHNARNRVQPPKRVSVCSIRVGAHYALYTHMSLG